MADGRVARIQTTLLEGLQCARRGQGNQIGPWFHSEKTETGLGGEVSSIYVEKRWFLVETKPQEETSHRHGHDITHPAPRTHTNMCLRGQEALLEDFTPLAGWISISSLLTQHALFTTVVKWSYFPLLYEFCSTWNEGSLNFNTRIDPKTTAGVCSSTGTCGILQVRWEQLLFPSVHHTEGLGSARGEPSLRCFCGLELRTAMDANDFLAVLCGEQSGRQG